MTQKPKIQNIECSCGKLMAWHSVELAGGVEVNVYRCDACDKLAARASEAAPDPVPLRA